MLACDGIWNVVDNGEVASFLFNRVWNVAGGGEVRAPDPEGIAEACDELLRECLRRNSRDNMTVQVVAMPGGSDESVGNEVGRHSRGRRVLKFDKQ